MTAPAATAITAGNVVSQDVPADPLPRRFGRYVLFDKIGEGGMARIYLGRSKTELGGEKLTVVKQILPMLSSSSEFSQLLVDEAKLAAKLSHGNVVQVVDLGRVDDTLYIAMDYVEGFDLRELLRQCSRSKTPLPVEFALLIVVETLRALDYAHRKKDDEGQALGIVHRDVSPSNVLVSFDGEVKLCDFGIARAMGASGDVPEEAIQGKAGYMSPEAARGETLDGRSDVFAVGVISWELLAGRRLYKGEAGRPPSIEQAREAIVPELPVRGYPQEERLHAIVMKALARDREQRHASAQVMLRELEQYVADAGLVASPLRLGEWLLDNFGAEIVERRRARERAAKAVEAGPLLAVQPTDQPSIEKELEQTPASIVQNEAPAPPQPRRNGLVVLVVALVVVALIAVVWLMQKP